MAQVLFYNTPEPLDSQKHRHLKINTQAASLAFAKTTNSVPLAVVEFGPAALEYPIVFAGPNVETLMPAALLGVRDRENLFVGSDGKWQGRYVPAFIRRYPFVLGQAKPDNFTVMIDTQSPLLQPDQGEALFTEQGEQTAYFKEVVKFLADYQAQMQRTQLLMQELRRLNLLVSKSLQVKDQSGKTFNLTGFWTVDEEKLRSLPEADAAAMLKNGMLGSIYAHLLSLANVVALHNRLKLAA